MIPKEGTNQEWDDLNQQLLDKEKEFQSHLTDVKRQIK
jgi:hypothetical protein